MIDLKRDNIGRFDIGNKGFWNGKTRDKDTREKIKNSLVGRFSSINHPGWKGGKNTRPDGYVRIICNGHPKSLNKKDNYVFEHVLVMEKHLGRYLEASEHIHHINGIKNDNRIENLQIVTAEEHTRIHQEQRHGKSFNLDIEKIKKHYLIDKFSANAISKIFNVSVHTIIKRLHKENIVIRSRNEQRRCAL